MWVFILAFVTVQLLVPVAALHARGGFPFAPGSLTEWSGAQVPYGWQMFSTTQTPAHYEVVSPETTLLVDPVARYGWFTGRAHYTGQVAQRLCAEFPEAVEVRQDERVVRCGDG